MTFKMLVGNGSRLVILALGRWEEDQEFKVIPVCTVNSFEISLGYTSPRLKKETKQNTR